MFNWILENFLKIDLYEMQICLTLAAVALPLRLQWRKTRKWILLGRRADRIRTKTRHFFLITTDVTERIRFCSFEFRPILCDLMKNSEESCHFFHSFRPFFKKMNYFDMQMRCKWMAQQVNVDRVSRPTERSASDLSCVLVKFRSKRIGEWPHLHRSTGRPRPGLFKWTERPWVGPGKE